MNKIQLAYIITHPAPYIDPFLAKLSEIPEIELHVYSLKSLDKGHSFWNLPAPKYVLHYFKQTFMTNQKFVYHFQILKLVLSKYDCFLFPGFNYPANVTGMLLCCLLRKPYIYTADSVREKNPGLVLRKIKGFLFKRASLLFVPGRASAAFFQDQYRVSPAKIRKGCYAMDGLLLESKIHEYRQKREKLLIKFALPLDVPVYLMVANFTKNRNYPTTAAGFLQAFPTLNKATFVMVGEGLDTNRIDEMSAKHPQLRRLNGLAFDEMLELYALANVYVHGGTEPASTALMISAWSHLPVISSNQVGHAHDCLRDGLNGVEIEIPDSSDAWSEGFTKIHQRQQEWGNMGNISRSLVDEFKLDNVVNEFHKQVTAIFQQA